MSIWAPSETEHEVGTSASERRDDLIVKLMDRVELLEMRMQTDKPETDVEAQVVSSQWTRNDTCIAILGWIGFSIFCIWLMATVTLSIWVRREKSKTT